MPRSGRADLAAQEAASAELRVGVHEGAWRAPRTRRFATRQRARLLEVWIAAALAGAVAIGWLLVLRHVALVWERNSDMAWPVLVGADFFSNPALAGWALSLYSGWTNEVVLYAIGVKVAGLRPELMSDIPVLLYALGMICAAALAWKGQRGRKQAAVAAVAALCLLGLPGPLLVGWLLQPGSHSTTVWCCVAAIALIALSAQSWRHAALLPVAAILVFAAIAADPLALVVGALPIIVASALLAIRKLRIGWAIAAALASAAAVAAAGLRSPDWHIEGFTYVGMRVQPVDHGQWWANLLEAGQRLLELIATGATASGAPAPPPPFLSLEHWPAWIWAAMVVLGAAWLVSAARAVVGLVKAREIEAAWIDLVLLLGVLANLAACAATGLGITVRYLLPAAVFALIGVARATPWLLERLPKPLWSLAALVVIVRVTYFGLLAATPVAADTRLPVERWLAAHHLHRGYGPFWDASVITVNTGSRVEVRPVNSDGRRLYPHYFYAKESWYGAGAEAGGARFVIYLLGADPDRDAGITDATAEGTFGKPSTVTTVGQYRVLVWDHDISADLGPARAR